MAESRSGGPRNPQSFHRCVEKEAGPAKPNLLTNEESDGPARLTAWASVQPIDSRQAAHARCVAWRRQILQLWVFLSSMGLFALLPSSVPCAPELPPPLSSVIE